MKIRPFFKSVVFELHDGTFLKADPVWFTRVEISQILSHEFSLLTGVPPPPIATNVLIEMTVPFVIRGANGSETEFFLPVPPLDLPDKV